MVDMDFPSNIVQANAFRETPEGETIASQPQERIRVLLVDDNLLFRDGVAQILTQDGRFEVVGRVSRGKQAISATASVRPDLILIDLRMPEMDGVEAIRLIRTQDAEVPIGLLTGMEGAQIQAALKAGATGYIAKDSSPAELCEAAVAMSRGPHQPSAQARGAPSRAFGSGLLSRLTPRELEVLRLVAGGASNPTIARSLGISPKTLRNHISNIYDKLHVHDRAQAVLLAAREGLIGMTR
jgi:DNA-binding NarL/FixJ family response regulator